MHSLNALNWLKISELYHNRNACKEHKNYDALACLPWDSIIILTLTAPNLTKSNKQAYLLAHAHSVFDNASTKYIYRAQKSRWLSWHAAGDVLHLVCGRSGDQARVANLFFVTVMRKYEQNVKFTFLHRIKLKLLIWNDFWKMNWFYALLLRKRN